MKIRILPAPVLAVVGLPEISFARRILREVVATLGLHSLVTAI